MLDRSTLSVPSDLAGALSQLRGRVQPDAVGLVLGSGLGAVADFVDEPWSLAYERLEGAPACAVEGHAGDLVLGKVEGREAIIFRGRAHLYEGHDPAEVTYAVRLLKALGARAVILTTAVGAVNPDYAVGDLMFIRDHLNLTGQDPVGHVPFAERLPAFPSMSRCYDPQLLERLTELAFALGVSYHRGVLAGVRGPCYETPAEVRALRVLGADAVSMSTVLEAGFAHYLGLPVLGLGVVANRAADAGGVAHAAVLEAVGRAAPRLGDLLRTALAELAW